MDEYKTKHLRFADALAHEGDNIPPPEARSGAAALARELDEQG